METIKLEKDFTKKYYEGWNKPVHFIQLVETETAYLYKREIGSYVDYEVFKKKVSKPTGKEMYPRATAFGKWAWSFKDIDKAYSKLYEITPSDAI